MRDSDGFGRMRTLQVVVLLVFALIIGRLAYIQLIDSRYGDLARANVLRHVVQYPPRGEVFDRNGEYLVQSRECYDLMVISSEIDKRGFDTARLCEVLNLPRVKLERELANARMRPRAPRLVMSYISKEDKLRFDECNFRGFYTVYRTVRRYPREVGGNLLGYVSEVNPDYLKRNPEYKTGDYVGMNGVESAYEPELRGRKGVKIQEIDTHGAIKGSYMNGVYDSLPEPGKYIVSTIDARLQLLGEELMRGKVGAAVAIEPSTGEILMMVSSPTYDPDELVGRERTSMVISVVYAAFSMAMVVVTSVGRLVASFLDWHVVMAGTLVMSVVSCVALAAVFPREGATDEPATASEQFGLLRESCVLSGIAIFVFGVGAVYVFYGYITPYLEGILGMTPVAASAVLMAYGTRRRPPITWWASRPT